MARVTTFRHPDFPPPPKTWKVTFSAAEMTQLRQRYPGVARKGPYSLLVHRNSVMWPPGQNGAAVGGAAGDTLDREAKRIVKAARRR
jgi:hypothetical protein